MILDLRRLEEGAELEAEVCVVGAGAAGIALAHALAAAGVDTVVLESGGLEDDAEVAALNEAESAGLPHHGLVHGRVRALGGATRVWPGQCMRLTPHDFERRPWVADSGWPLDAAALEPFYARAEALLGVTRDAAALDPWTAFGATAPAFDETALRADVGVFAPRPALARLLRAAPARTVLHATVTALAADEARSRVESVEARSLDGRGVRVRARRVVLAAGGIENPRLLLASGLGSAATGRFFQDHPVARSARLLSDDPRALQEVFGVFGRRRRYYPKLVLPPTAQARERILNCSGNVVYEFPFRSAPEAALRVGRRLRSRRPPAAWDVVDALRGAGAVAATGARLLRGRPAVAPPESIALLLVCEQAPNPDSRITLSEERDRLGVPRARLDWRLTDAERRTMEVVTGVVAGELGRLGLARVEPADWLDGRSGTWLEHVQDSFHHMGATRMADDPGRGVVDADCRVHGVANLYVAGSSVFPTSGYANPTATIVALSLRLADLLERELGA